MIYTGYYKNMERMLPNAGYHFVSISRGNPSWFPYPLEDLNALKPSWELVEMAKKHDYENYLTEYHKQLETVSIRDIMNELQDNTILLCYESPDKFCHRHIVRNWFNEKGILCREITFGPHGEENITER